MYVLYYGNINLWNAAFTVFAVAIVKRVNFFSGNAESMEKFTGKQRKYIYTTKTA